jgi:hypothetical protein
VPGEGRLKANDAMRYSRAREHDLMFEVCREASTSVKTATDLDEQLLAYCFVQISGMNPERIQVFRTSDSSPVNQCNQPFDGEPCFWQGPSLSKRHCGCRNVYG